MITEDFNYKMIAMIKNHPWALQTYPEFINAQNEAKFMFHLKHFIRYCKNDVVEKEALSVLDKLLRELDNDEVRQNVMYDELGLGSSWPLSAAILCTLSFRIASIQCKDSHEEVDNINFYYDAHLKHYFVNPNHDYFTQCEIELMQLYKKEPSPSDHWIKPLVSPKLEIKPTPPSPEIQSHTLSPLSFSTLPKPAKRNTFSHCIQQ